MKSYLAHEKRLNRRETEYRKWRTGPALLWAYYLNNWPVRPSRQWCGFLPGRSTATAEEVAANGDGCVARCTARIGGVYACKLGAHQLAQRTTSGFKSFLVLKTERFAAPIFGRSTVVPTCAARTRLLPLVPLSCAVCTYVAYIVL